MDSARKEKESKPAHGPPLQARVVAANRTVRTTCASILAHMAMNKGGKAKLTGGKLMRRAVGMEWQRWNGRQTKPAKQGRCRQPQPADDLTGTGLEAQLQTIRPVQASQQNNSQQTSLAGLSPCSAGWWRECGGAGHSKGGLRPTYLSPSHLSPLPVTVYTHSLN